MDHPIVVSSAFDSGNIEVIDTAGRIVKLAIAPDNNADFFQWFYFRVSTPAGQRCAFRIINAGQVSYPRGFENYRVVVSDNHTHWRRLPTEFRDGMLEFEHDMPSGMCWFAYFTPYTLEQHNLLVARCVQSAEVSHEVLTKTHDGHDLDLLVVGDRRAEVVIWAIARQHPGESMAEWWMQGFLEKLCDRHDAVSRQLLSKAAIYVVPNMNPDGTVRGNLRSNAVGTNLNREWQSPTIEGSPEVFSVREKMHTTGVQYCIDVHGDEALPYNFIAGTQGIVSWNEQRNQHLNNFKHSLAVNNPDFQTLHGYPTPAPGSANYAICSSYVAETFGCLAVTLEMPFKDTVDSPDSEFGWSAERSKKLGASFVDALLNDINTR